MNRNYYEGWNNGYDCGVAAKKVVIHANDTKWQEVTVDPKGAGHTYRLRVPGGWLYRTVTYRFPETHEKLENEREDFEDLLNSIDEDHGYRHGIRVALAAQEIIAQTTVFVPDNV